MPIFVGPEFSLAHFKAIFGHIGASESFLEGSEKLDMTNYGQIWVVIFKKSVIVFFFIRIT